MSTLLLAVAVAILAREVWHLRRLTNSLQERQRYLMGRE